VHDGRVARAAPWRAVLRAKGGLDSHGAVSSAVRIRRTLVGDVVATKFGPKGEPQAKRAIEAITKDGSKIRVELGTPRTGGQRVTATFEGTKNVLVTGRVSELKPKAAKPKAKATPKAATKVDAVAQTTPVEAKPTPRTKPTKAAKDVRTLADRIAEKLQAHVERIVDEALDQAIDQAITKVLG
jgi:hypothetical protein